MDKSKTDLYLDWTGIQKAVAAGKLKAGKDQCFGFFMVLWLNRIRQDVKESTFSRYHFLLRTHIFPELGQIPLTELDNGILEDFVREKRTSGSRNGGGLSPKTVNCLISGCCQGQVIPFIHSHTVRWPTRETELVFYAVLLTFAIIGVIKNKTNGTLYPLYMIAYGIFRFVIEWFRVTEHTIGPFHISHFWSLLALIIGASVYFEIHNKSKKKRSKQHV